MDYLLRPLLLAACLFLTSAGVYGGGRCCYSLHLPCSLHLAVNWGDLERVKTLLKNPKVVEDVKARWHCCLHPDPVLHIAAACGDVAMVRVLLDAGAPLNTALGSEALFYAAQQGHEGVAALLIRRGANLDGCVMTNTPLHAAAINGHTGVVRRLLNAGAQVDVMDILGRTPLYGAAGAGHVDIVEVLLAAGADPVSEYRTWNGLVYTPLSVAREKLQSSERTTPEMLDRYQRIVALLERAEQIWGNVRRAVEEDGMYVGVAGLFEAAGAAERLREETSELSDWALERMTTLAGERFREYLEAERYVGIEELFEEGVGNGMLTMELNAPGDGFGESDDDGEVRKPCHRPVSYGSSSW